MSSVRVGSVDVAYGKDGSGDPVVLVHGTSSDRTSFALQIPGLAEKYTVITPEYSGSGQSVDHEPDAVLTVEMLAEQMLGAADDAGATRFHVAGWSLGAVVASAVAAMAPDRVKSVVLVNGWVATDARMNFTFDFWNRLFAHSPEMFARYALADGLTAASHQAFGFEGVDGLVGDFAANFAPGTKRQIDLDRVVDISAMLSKITAPTLVIGGIEDRWVDIVHSRELAEKIKNAKLVELACGHLVPTEQAEKLTSLMLEHFGSAA